MRLQKRLFAPQEYPLPLPHHLFCSFFHLAVRRKQQRYLAALNKES